jgi:drug/metabolite transporter (DMT)-like permease
VARRNDNRLFLPLYFNIWENAAVIGILLGLGSALFFGANSVITRRGMLRVSSNYVATISIFIGLIFFLIAVTITGQFPDVFRLSWKAYLFWSLSGIIHFSLGRTWAYRSIQLLGSNRSNVVTSLSPIATVALALLLLKESVSPIQVVGIVCTLLGPILIILKEETALESTKTASGSYGKDVDTRTMVLGVLYGAGAALFWGSSAVFIKFGLEAGGSPVLGTLIAYAGACLVTSPSFLLNASNRKEILSGGIKLLPVTILSGLTTSIAQLLRYISFQYGTVIVVSLMLRTMPIWIIIFAFMFNREYESFSRWVFISNGLILIGTVLVMMS